MPRRKPLTYETPVTFPRDAILDDMHVAAMLRCAVERIAIEDFACFYVGTKRKYVCGQVLDEMAKRARGDATPDIQPAPRRHRRRIS